MAGPDGTICTDGEVRRNASTAASVSMSVNRHQMRKLPGLLNKEDA